MKDYDIHNNITRELLDSIKPGDLVKVNDWKMPMRVKGVSQNYFVMSRKQSGKTCYSVVSKRVATWRHNDIMPGFFYCGPDAWLFGWNCDEYKMEDAEWVAAYLASFEQPTPGHLEPSEISVRRACSIRMMMIKRAAVNEPGGTEDGH